MAIPAGLLAGASSAKGILPQGMGVAKGLAPAAGMAGQAGALAAPSTSSLSMAPAAGATAAPSYASNPYTNSTGGANAGGGYTGGGGGTSFSPAAGTAVAASAPSAGLSVGGGSTDRSTNINPYGAQNTRPSDWLTGGGGSHAMQEIVNRDPFAARGMEGDLGAYGINVPNTGSLKPSDVGLGGSPMSRDPYSAREAATGFGPVYSHTPTSPASAPWQGMGYGTPTPGYLSQGGSHAIDNPIAAGTPTLGYSPQVAGGTPTQGYEPHAPGFSGVTRDRLNAAVAGQPIAAGTPLQGYEPAPAPAAAGTPTSGYNPAVQKDLYHGGPFSVGDLFGGPEPAVAAPNPFASVGDFFSPPSQGAVDRMAGGYGVAPPVSGSPGFLEAGGASYATPRPPQYRPSVPGANPRPQQSGDITGPSNIPGPYADVGGPRLPSPRPDVGINPFGLRMPSYGAARVPQSRPDPWGDWYDRMGGYA